MVVFFVFFLKQAREHLDPGGQEATVQVEVVAPPIVSSSKQKEGLKQNITAEF